jgi:hypothetical protein
MVERNRRVSICDLLFVAVHSPEQYLAPVSGRQQGEQRGRLGAR